MVRNNATKLELTGGWESGLFNWDSLNLCFETPHVFDHIDMSWPLVIVSPFLKLHHFE